MSTDAISQTCFAAVPRRPRLRARSGNASRVGRRARFAILGELNALGDSAPARPIASTTPLLTEPMADRTLPSRLYLPVRAHLASVDPASGRWEDSSFLPGSARSTRLDPALGSLLFSFPAFLSIVSLVTHRSACHPSTLIVNKSSGGLYIADSQL